MGRFRIRLPCGFHFASTLDIISDARGWLLSLLRFRFSLGLLRLAWPERLAVDNELVGVVPLYVQICYVFHAGNFDVDQVLAGQVTDIDVGVVRVVLRLRGAVGEIGKKALVLMRSLMGMVNDWRELSLLAVCGSDGLEWAGLTGGPVGSSQTTTMVSCARSQWYMLKVSGMNSCFRFLQCW